MTSLAEKAAQRWTITPAGREALAAAEAQAEEEEAASLYGGGSFLYEMAPEEREAYLAALEPRWRVTPKGLAALALARLAAGEGAR